ncbi:hypothetical protein L226DRAFT_13545 [Lentinus tigrinus ALCF2SS1-7]|uniref:uncharacterized protein n=1 Tax=Lentinus tigrinus ALCF2SS1-7 TaxID=1328758 RepID=UPI0011660A82|nr:hypothetical protein L226DRAFT_13545 [Lentinus tigrinus ALCF2SS1-7]
MEDPRQGMSDRARVCGRKQTYGLVIDMKQSGSVEHIGGCARAGRTKVEVTSARYAPSRRCKYILGSRGGLVGSKMERSSMTAVHNAGPGVPVRDLRHQVHHALSGENHPYLRCCAVPSLWLLRAALVHIMSTPRAVVRCTFSKLGDRSVDQQVKGRSRSCVVARRISRSSSVADSADFEISVGQQL